MVNPTVAGLVGLPGHSEAVRIETRTKVTVEEVQKLLNSEPEVVLPDGLGPDFGKPPYVRYRSTGEI